MTIEKIQVGLLIFCFGCIIFAIFSLLPPVVITILESIQYYTGFGKLPTILTFWVGLIAISLVFTGILELFKKEDTIGNENTDE